MKNLLLSLILTQGLIAAPIQTGLIHDAIRDNNLELIKDLMENGYDINAKDNHGNTPLHTAVRYLYKDIIQVLIENPLCDHTITNDDNKTPKDLIKIIINENILLILNNALSVKQKITNLEHGGLVLLAAKVTNRIGISKNELLTIPYNIRPLIINTY